VQVRAFVVTIEVRRPSGSRRADDAQHRRDLVDAITSLTAPALIAMSSAAAAFCRQRAHPAAHLLPRLQPHCAQGDVLAAALGVRNILCLTETMSKGDHPQAKPVFDLDAVSLLHIARGMCDQGEFASGRKLDRAPDLFIGATVNPFVPPYRDRVANLENKIVAGARFIQTQFCFDVPMADFMREVRTRELHKRSAIIVGAPP
jgi:5,10-methylenetetrahydrofolate reductase